MIQTLTLADKIAQRKTDLANNNCSHYPLYNLILSASRGWKYDLAAQGDKRAGIRYFKYAKDNDDMV